MYEIGTSPYFTNVASGEVTDLPTDSPQQRATEVYEEAAASKRPVYPGGQQVVEYPSYVPEPVYPQGPHIGHIPVHTAQFHPQQSHYQPEDPLVVVVEDRGDIDVDGGCKINGTINVICSKCKQIHISFEFENMFFCYSHLPPVTAEI